MQPLTRSFAGQKFFSWVDYFVVGSLWIVVGRSGFINYVVWKRHIGGQKLSTNMAAGNQQKHLEFTFSIKALPFHSRASIRAHKHIF